MTEEENNEKSERKIIKSDRIYILIMLIIVLSILLIHIIQYMS